jgi:hypothetical protein
MQGFLEGRNRERADDNRWLFASWQGWRTDGRWPPGRRIRDKRHRQSGWPRVYHLRLPDRAAILAAAQQERNFMHDIRPGQSTELLKELHILTRDGRMNQDSRRKLKQVYHLYQFIEPLLLKVQQQGRIRLVDCGAGKSYLGFILYDLFFKSLAWDAQVIGIETREELVQKSRELAKRLGYSAMSFMNLQVEQAIASADLPDTVDIVTALHACDTATDDAIRFALAKQARFIVLAPCCQAEVAAVLRRNKAKSNSARPLAEIWRHPLHTREFGSHITNVLRCLQLEAHGYQVTVTELVGWEHSMKNELIVASYNPDVPSRRAAERLNKMLEEIGLDALRERFFTGADPVATSPEGAS